MYYYFANNFISLIICHTLVATIYVLLGTCYISVTGESPLYVTVSSSLKQLILDLQHFYVFLFITYIQLMA